MFAVRIQWMGKDDWNLGWDNGELFGDISLATAVQVEAALREGQPFGPPGGPYTLNNHLSSPLSALFLMREVFGFQNLLESEGDVPHLDPPPEGYKV